MDGNIPGGNETAGLVIIIFKSEWEHPTLVWLDTHILSKIFAGLVTPDKITDGTYCEPNRYCDYNLGRFMIIKKIVFKHLNENGIRYFCALSKEFVLITTNTRHPAFNVEDENLHIIYQNELSLKDALIKLKSEYGCERITIQTGGTLNNLFLREKLFDYVDIIIAPVLIGGKDTSTLIDGKSLTEECELSKLGVVKLQECVVLENSYLRLRYEVIH